MKEFSCNFHVVITGPSGVGKTLVARYLHEILTKKNIESSFIEGDDFHSKNNREKMSNGIPLNDEDRIPWLISLSKWMSKQYKTINIVTCSALKKSYRDILNINYDNSKVIFYQLTLPLDIHIERLKNRKDHFMKLEMLQSQLEILDHSDTLIINNDGTAEETAYKIFKDILIQNKIKDNLKMNFKKYSAQK